MISETIINIVQGYCVCSWIKLVWLLRQQQARLNGSRFAVRTVDRGLKNIKWHGVAF